MWHPFIAAAYVILALVGLSIELSPSFIRYERQLSCSTLPLKSFKNKPTHANTELNILKNEFVHTVNWISFVLMLFVATALIYFVVRSTQMAWDYAITFSFVHFILSTIVTAAATGVGFPVNPVWWVTLLVGTFVLSSLAELSCYYLRDMRSIKVDHE